MSFGGVRGNLGPLAVLAGLWILFLIVVQLLLDVQQIRQYVDNLRLSGPASTGEKRK